MPKKEQGLIKYIGNKTKYAEFIARHFPLDIKLYIEPFFGSGALLGAVKPKASIAIDSHKPLIDMWILARDKPELLLDFYNRKWTAYSVDAESKKAIYRDVVNSYNEKPNPLDFLFISRTCYGGVLRYRKADGALSTPVGAHLAIPPDAFAKRLARWNKIIANTKFICDDFSVVKDFLGDGVVVYCDPPYVDSQKILYGAQSFTLNRLMEEMKFWKEKGAFYALSIDGTKRSGEVCIDIAFDKGLFQQEVEVELGGSMLKRFQLKEQNTSQHKVTDRLLLSHEIDLSSKQLALQI